MAIPHGKNTSILVGAVDISAFCNSVEGSAEFDDLESTTFSVAASHKTFEPGNMEGSVQLGGFVSMNTAPDTTGSDYILRQALGAANRPVSIAWGGWAIGNGAWVVPAAFERTYTPGMEVGSLATWTAELRGTSDIRSGNSLHSPVTAETSTTAATAANSVDLGAIFSAAVTRWLANLHVISGTGSLTAKVFDSGNNITFAAMATPCTFTAATGATSEQKTGTGIVRRYVCFDSTISGGGATFNYAIAFAAVI